MRASILLNGRLISYDLQRKKVKNINIRIKRDLTVSVSASPRVPLQAIEKILTEKSDFILSALQKYERQLESTVLAEKDRQSVTVFGKALPIEVILGKKNCAEIFQDKILVTLKDATDLSAHEKAVSTALDTLCRDTVTDLCGKIYPRFSSYTTDFPTVKFRHMKTRWGSCNYKKGILTFNYALVHAPFDCIEYVVYHEFTHFVHPDHSKDFYSHLSLHVPDYKEKKKRLEAVTIFLN